MALLKSINNQPIGVIFFIAPAWRQGYYWREGMTSSVFFDHPKQLSNDTVWLTNAHFDVTKNYGGYIKQYRFFRTPMHRIIHELSLDKLPLDKQVEKIGPFLARLNSCFESNLLYHSDTLINAMSQTIAKIKTPDLTWQQLGVEAKKWYWQGSVKHKLLMGGSLYAPRFDFARQLIQCQVPDFSKPPKVLKGEFKGLILQNLIKDHVGFVRVSIENLKPEVRDFVDLNRMLFTTNEVLWLINFADVTAKVLYLTTAINHPAFDREKLELNFKPFSWLDGIRLEALALAPTYKNIPMEAFIRGTAHIAMAHYAWYLNTKKNLAPIALSYGKIGIAYNRQEEAKIRKASIESGLLFATAEEEGLDLSIGRGL